MSVAKSRFLAATRSDEIPSLEAELRPLTEESKRIERECLAEQLRLTELLCKVFSPLEEHRAKTGEKSSRLIELIHGIHGERAADQHTLMSTADPRFEEKTLELSSENGSLLSVAQSLQDEIQRLTKKTSRQQLVATMEAAEQTIGDPAWGPDGQSSNAGEIYLRASALLGKIDDLQSQLDTIQSKVDANEQLQAELNERVFDWRSFPID